jgi:hypothetical protein
MPTCIYHGTPTPCQTCRDKKMGAFAWGICDVHGTPKPCQQCRAIHGAPKKYIPPQARRSRTLDELPKEKWWKLFIDKKYHGQHDPETYFDRDQSSGYSTAMRKAFEVTLCKRGECFGVRVDAKLYLALHGLVISGVLINEKGSKWSEYTSDKVTTFGMYNWEHWEQDPKAFGIAEQEVSDAIKEMCKEGLIYTLDQAMSLQKKAEIGVRVITAMGRAQIGYTSGECSVRVGKIFSIYYEAMGVTDDREQRLAIIARTIRALHVGHFFRDANGRLNIFVLLNKLLSDAGFCPVILPHGPEVFGGMKTIARLMEDIEDGMRAFRAELD